MSEDFEAPSPRYRRLLLSPWGVAFVILGIFVLGEAYLALRDRAVQASLQAYPPFTTPAFDLSFSKHIPYDPLSFVGHGAQRGFWQWTPDGLVLTDQGREFFDDTGEMFVSKAPAGTRRVQRIRINIAISGGRRQVEFIYEWAEISPVAAALLTLPPHLKEQYPGQATLARDAGAWKVTSLHTLDFDESLAHLQQAASGVRK